MMKDEAIKVLEYALECVDEETPKGANEAEAIPMAIEALKDRPTAKWTTNKLGYFECTACKTMLFMKQRDWRFCPYCGAVLEGEDE